VQEAPALPTSRGRGSTATGLWALSAAGGLRLWRGATWEAPGLLSGPAVAAGGTPDDLWVVSTDTDRTLATRALYHLDGIAAERYRSPGTVADVREVDGHIYARALDDLDDAVWEPASGRWMLRPELDPEAILATGPGPEARHALTSFHQDKAFLQNLFAHANDRHALQHLGSWHSHHGLSLAEPSLGDHATMVSALRASPRTLLPASRP